jgi:hypothetical protein
VFNVNTPIPNHADMISSAPRTHHTMPYPAPIGTARPGLAAHPPSSSPKLAPLPAEITRCTSQPTAAESLPTNIATIPIMPIICMSTPNTTPPTRPPITPAMTLLTSPSRRGAACAVVMIIPPSLGRADGRRGVARRR